MHVRSHPAIRKPRGTVIALDRQGIQFRQCLLFKSHVVKSQKKLGVLIYSWLDCIYLCIFQQMTLPLYSRGDGHVEKHEAFFQVH